MAAHQSRIAANLSRFRQLFHTRDLDYRIGVLTTDFVNADPGSRPEDQPFFKPVRSNEFDAAGQLTDETTAKYLAAYLVAFHAWVLRFT